LADFLSRVTYKPSSGVTAYAVPFVFDQELSSLEVTLDGTTLTGWGYNSSTHSVVLSSAVTGTALLIKRITDVSSPEVTFSDSSVLEQEDLNAATLQILYRQQEEQDAEIIREATLQNAVDAVKAAQLAAETAAQSAADAAVATFTEEVDQALIDANAAKLAAQSSATSAATSASTATTKATQAANSATGAAGSATTATTKANEAANSATQAAEKAEAFSLLTADKTVTLGVSGKPSVLVSAITADGTTASATLTDTHGFAVGDYVNIDNTANFNGTFLVTEVFVYTIRWASAVNATETGLATTMARYKQAAVSSATIQAAIDATAKNLNGFVCTLNFNDGYYYQDASLAIKKFYGGRFKLAALTTSTSKAVKFGGSLTGANGIVTVQDCPATVELSRINIVNNTVNTSTNYCYGLTITNANRVYLFYASAVLPNAVTSPGTSRGISIDNSNLLLSGANVEGGAYGIYALNSAIKNYNPANTGTRPATGVYVYASSLDGAVITGTTANTAGQSVYTLLPGYTASRAASGYQKLPQDGNGAATIEQWGTTTVTFSSVSKASVAVTFPITFPTSCANVSAVVVDSVLNPMVHVHSISGKTTSGVTIWATSEAATSQSGTFTVEWRAIGY